MAKLGELSEDEKSLFLHINKGKKDIMWLVDILILISFSSFLILGFLGNDQEALRLLSSGNVRVDCLDEV